MRKLLFLLVLFSPSYIYAGFEDAVDSVVRLNVPVLKEVQVKQKDGTEKTETKTLWAGGTGVVFQQNKDYFWVLTAGHVMGEAKSCWATCYNNGYELEKVPAYVVMIQWNKIIDKNADIQDLSVLAIERKAFKNCCYPKVSSLPPKNTLITTDRPIYSIGCPELRWPSCWKGRISEQTNNNLFLFTPNPIGGRSGSPIFNSDFKIIGILIWQGIDGDKGAAISLNGIYKYPIWKDQ